MRNDWRRGQDSNLHILSDGGFQDRCTTNYATPPRLGSWNYNVGVRLAQLGALLLSGDPDGKSIFLSNLNNYGFLHGGKAAPNYRFPAFGN